MGILSAGSACMYDVEGNILTTTQCPVGAVACIVSAVGCDVVKSFNTPALLPSFIVADVPIAYLEMLPANANRITLKGNGISRVGDLRLDRDGKPSTTISLYAYPCDASTLPSPSSLVVTIALVSVLVVGIIVVVFCLVRRRHASSSPFFPTSRTTRRLSSSFFLNSPPKATIRGSLVGLHDVRFDPAVASARLARSDLRSVHTVHADGLAIVSFGYWKVHVPVTIRQLQPNTPVSSIATFMDEVQTCVSIVHDHVVPCVGVAWSTSSDIAIVSEHMEGGTLQSHMAQYGHTRQFHAAKWVVAFQIADALVYLHAQSIIYRTLHAESVLLSADGHPKLSNHGLRRTNRRRNDGGGVSLVWSHLASTAPELLNRGDHTSASDVYALGVLLCELDKGTSFSSVDLKVGDSFPKPPPIRKVYLTANLRLHQIIGVMVDHRGRIRARQISILNARCRLHSPLYRNTRSTVSTSSRSSVEDYEESRIVRSSSPSRSPSRSPIRVVQRQMFFGDDYADSDSDCPAKEVEFHSEVIKPSAPNEFVRTTTTTTTKTVVCEQQMHIESDVETNSSSVAAMDNAWEMSTTGMARRSTADSAPSSNFSASPCERQKSRHHPHYIRPTFSSALAQSTGMSDTLARMKLRKQEVEMASVVDKVQKQMIAMESVLKELQLEHRVKCDLLERQIVLTTRVEQEKTALQQQLEAVTRQLVALQSHKEGETMQNVNYLSVAMTAFMNQSEQAQNLMLNQLKSLDERPSTQSKDPSADMLERLTSYHQDVLAALQATAAPPAKVAEPVTVVRRSHTMATEAIDPAPLAIASPAPTSPSLFTSQRLMGALIFCIGVGAGALNLSSTKDVHSSSPVVHAPFDVEMLVEKLKQVYKAPEPSASSQWVETVPDVVVEKAPEVLKTVQQVKFPVKTTQAAPVKVLDAREEKPADVKEPKEDVSTSKQVVVEAIKTPQDVSAQIALMLKLTNTKKPASVPATEGNVAPSLETVEKKPSVDTSPRRPLIQEQLPGFNVSLVEAPTTLATDGVVEAVATETTPELSAEIAFENATQTPSKVLPLSVDAAGVEAVPIVADHVLEEPKVVSSDANATKAATVERNVSYDEVDASALSEGLATDVLPASAFDSLALALRSLVYPSQANASKTTPKVNAPLASKSSGRHLWKRGDVQAALGEPVEITTEDLPTSTVAVVAATDNATAVVSPVEEAVVVAAEPIAEANVTTTSFEGAPVKKEQAWLNASSEQATRPVTLSTSWVAPWADSVYSTPFLPKSQPVEVANTNVSVLPKLTLPPLDLPTCAWNMSVAPEVSRNPFYVSKTIGAPILQQLPTAVPVSTALNDMVAATHLNVSNVWLSEVVLNLEKESPADAPLEDALGTAPVLTTGKSDDAEPVVAKAEGIPEEHEQVVALPDVESVGAVEAAEVPVFETDAVVPPRSDKVVEVAVEDKLEAAVVVPVATEVNDVAPVIPQLAQEVVEVVLETKLEAKVVAGEVVEVPVVAQVLEEAVDVAIELHPEPVGVVVGDVSEVDRVVVEAAVTTEATGAASEVVSEIEAETVVASTVLVEADVVVQVAPDIAVVATSPEAEPFEVVAEVSVIAEAKLDAVAQTLSLADEVVDVQNVVAQTLPLADKVVDVQNVVAQTLPLAVEVVDVQNVVAQTLPLADEVVDVQDVVAHTESVEVVAVAPVASVMANVEVPASVETEPAGEANPLTDVAESAATEGTLAAVSLAADVVDSP
ncbi:hypothetical protein DYB38_003865 [Aphanomyces astaci]|uniref:Protein kinase domain-containing protein n=1 Tax=Aphanomyces astaci TaxID=112090 RepID=A0A397DAL3_APHAT|nr:hypothetical protein DYB38_003865 [Aphanomyces astaci]